MEEIWKDIPGYEGRYQASTMGRIRSVDRFVYGKSRGSGTVYRRRIRGQVLRPGRYCKSGHVSVILGHKAHGSPVHQLVMRTFVGKPPEGQEVLHRNGDPTDNRLENLHYGSRTENILDVFYQGKKWRKLDIEDVGAIRFGLATGIAQRELASMYNVSVSTISGIKRGRNYRWLK